MRQKIEITLADVSEFIVDCLHNTALTQEDGYPLIRTPNIGKGRLILDGVFRVSEDTYNIWTRRATPQPNDLILAREATAGNVAIIKEGQTVCLGQRTVHIRPNITKVDPDFLCYYLLTPESQGKLLANETGATSKHVNMKDIRKLPLSNIPELSVQRKIGSIISQYDDLIENNRRRIKLLEETARLLYQEWFVRLRFPGHEHSKIVDGVPEGWKVGKIEDIALLLPGFAFKSKDWQDFGSPVIKIKNIVGDGSISINNCDKVDQSVVEKASKFIIKPGSLLIAMTGATIGKIGIMPNVKNEFYLNQRVGVFKEKSIPEISLFLYTFFSTNVSQEVITNLASGAAQPNISGKQIESIELLIPPKKILNLYIDTTKPLFHTRLLLEEQNGLLIKARDLLLPRLMNGVIPI